MSGNGFCSLRVSMCLLLLGLVVVVPSQPNAETSAFRFPRGFRWCAATAAHQIEGGNFQSDWWPWENQSGHVKNGETSEVADDHWNRVDEDISLMKSLGLTDYRMSIEWARIEPSQGSIDAAAVDHYRYEVKALLAAGITPIITLQHFTFPLWIREKGGFEWEGTPAALSKYTSLVYTDIAPEVRDWVTINEPLVSVVAGYVAGSHPPSEKRSLQDILPVVRGILRAHAQMYHTLHDLAQLTHAKVRVGMAHHLRTEDPLNRWNPLDHFASRIADEVWNWAAPTALETGRFKIDAFPVLNVDEEIEGLKNTQDFIGINYYSGDFVSYSPSGGFQQFRRQDLPTTDLGWAIYPEGFYRLMMEATNRFPTKPILITENGIADASDSKRKQFIHDHLREVAHAIEDGAKVEGYCHWSLMDNFEWQEGYTPRFGLYEVDYRTQERKLRSSASDFSKIIRRNKIERE